MTKDNGKKLAILGTAESVIKPDYNSDMEFWGCGSCFNNAPVTNEIKRIDRGIEIHQEDTINHLLTKKGTNYNKFGNIPIWVQEKMINDSIIKDNINNPIPFPLEEIKKYVEYDKYSKSFNCSHDYLIVMAAMMGYKEIYFYKMLLKYGQEYYFENPSVSWWCEYLAKKEEIKFYFPEDSDLFRQDYLYGYQVPQNKIKFFTIKKCLFTDIRMHYSWFVEHISKYNYNWGMLQGIELIRQVNKKKITLERAEEIAQKALALADEHLPKAKDREENFFRVLGQVEGIDLIEKDIK